jgi:hypothetical protein
MYDDNEPENYKSNEFKNIDKNYHEIIRIAPIERKGIVTYKKKQIGIYTSGDIGSRIRNAETGEHYKYRVGSKYEKLFFSVRLSTGECDGKNKMATLFFTSPNHYEKYLHNEVSEEVGKIWNYKRDLLINELNEKKHRLL